MSRVLTIGAGYVGLVTAACLAKLGHEVAVYDVDEDKQAALRAGRVPIQEPGLTELWAEGVNRGLLRVASTLEDAGDCRFALLAVGTPATAAGRPDLAQIESAVHALAAVQGVSRPVIVIKSTVPPGTSSRVHHLLEQADWCESPRVASNPEFLREGRAIVDFLRPDRIVIGAADAATAAEVAGLYQALRRPVITCSAETAEMIKYASNVFLCTKISFINEIAALCEHTGVDVKDVSQALEMDARVGQGYLEAGLGWGGSCLPKDIRGVISAARELQVATPLLDSVLQVNEQQPVNVVGKLQRLLGTLAGAEVAVLGLTFKPNCDDLRDSPSLQLVRLLQQAGSHVRVYDPVATEAAAALLPGVEIAEDEYAAIRGADATVLSCAWKQFLNLDLTVICSSMRRPFFIDGRNALSPRAAQQAGLVYIGIGREQPAVLGEAERQPAAVVEVAA